MHSKQHVVGGVPMGSPRSWQWVLHQGLLLQLATSPNREVRQGLMLVTWAPSLQPQAAADRGSGSTFEILHIG
jgi:hypothetical protein